MKNEEICDICGYAQDDHSLSHLGSECYPKLIKNLEKKVSDLSAELDKYKASLEKLNFTDVKISKLLNKLSANNTISILKSIEFIVQEVLKNENKGN